MNISTVIAVTFKLPDDIKEHRKWCHEQDFTKWKIVDSKAIYSDEDECRDVMYIQSNDIDI